MDSRKRTIDDVDGGVDQIEDDKRLREDPTNELIANVCKDLRRIGENGNLLNQVDDINYISNPIVIEFERLDKLRVAILNSLNAIVLEQPQKISSLSVLVLICNAKNFLIPKYVIEFFHSKIQHYLGSKTAAENDDNVGDGMDQDKLDDPLSDNFNNIKNILKFLCCLSSIIEGNDLFEILNQLLQLSKSLISSNKTLAQEIFYNTLVCLPYILSNDWTDDNIAEINKLIEVAESIPIHGDDGDTKGTDLYQFFNNKLDNFSVPYEIHKLINLILPSLKQLQQSNFAAVKDLFIDYNELISPIITESLQANKISNELVKHKLPQFYINEALISKYNPNLNSSASSRGIDSLWSNNPRLILEIYHHCNPLLSFNTLPDSKSYFGIFFKDLCMDIITNLSYNKNETAIQLSILDLYFNKKLFSPPGSSVETLAEIDKDNKQGENTPPLSTWKIEDVFIECVLNMIFQLPNAINYEVYYYTVLIACCKENPESIAPVFGRAIRFLYNHLETIDLEVKFKFMDWMSIQISNFEFSWKWDEWVKDCVELSNLVYHPKYSFMKNLIQKEVKLSNKKRIKESFVALNPNPNDDNEIIELTEFNKFLSLSVFENPSEFIIEYDSKLFGNNPEITELITNLQHDREQLMSKLLSLLPQQEMLYNFLNDRFPYHNNCSRFHKFLLSNHKLKKDYYGAIEELRTEIFDDQEDEAKTNTNDSDKNDDANINADKNEDTNMEDGNENGNENVKGTSENIIQPYRYSKNMNKEQFLINFVFQTYCYIGSRSIYSTISILNRDLVKLKWLSGHKLTDQDYVGSSEDFKFPEFVKDEQHFNTIQHYIVDAIFRIWIHQPQFLFLTLEYLVENGVVELKPLVDKCFDLSTNLILSNITCFESFARLLSSFDGTTKSTCLSYIFGAIIKNLNQIFSDISLTEDATIVIDKLSSPQDLEDPEFSRKVNLQYLIFDYIDLYKCYLRKYSTASEENNTEAKELANTLTNNQVKTLLSTLIDQRM